jgi:hypothetical protein
MKLRRVILTGNVARMREMRDSYTTLDVNPERKRPLGRSRRRWEVNIKIYLKEIGCEDMD